MPTWSDLLKEIAAARDASMQVYDRLRRKYLEQLSTYLEKPVIVYASAFLQKPDASINELMMSNDDMEGFMEVVHGLRTREVYLVLHSPGGAAETAESIVRYLRSKFDRITVVVPHMAKSAATMLACAAEQIIIAKHGELGPIDPQFVLQTPLGLRMVPALSIINQFSAAADDVRRNQQAAAIWYPMLAQYGPGLLEEATQAVELSELLVKEWLASYMFNGRRNAKRLASRVARYLADYDRHKTHRRRLGHDALSRRGMNVTLLESDQKLQDLVMTVYHATMHTFANTAAFKIIENHTGKAFIRLLRQPQS